MNYRPKILLIFALLLGLMFYGAMGYTQAKTALSTEQSKSATYSEKTSSSNIHIDDIVIKNSTAAQSGNSAISEEDHKRLVSDISNDAEKEVSSWVTRQMLFGAFAILLAAIAATSAYISRAIEKSVEKLVKEEMARSNRLIDNAVSRLVDKQAEIVVATDKTIEATTNANDEIEQAKKTLKEIKDKEKEINKKLKDFQDEIEKKEEEISNIDLRLSKNYIDFELRATDEIFRLEQKINALERIINKMDKNGTAKNEIVDELIADLKSDDKETKYSAADLLPQFELESNKITEITNAFIEILKNKPDTTFGSLLLSGLGELGGNDETLSYLLELVKDISNPCILAIIGALGELSEAVIKDTESESIVNQLSLILQDDLDAKEFALDITASKVRGAIALALSWYGKKAANAENNVIKLLEDPEPETRKNAAIALEKIGSKDTAIPVLQKLENDEYIEVSDAAKKAIEELQNL